MKYLVPWTPKKSLRLDHFLTTVSNHSKTFLQKLINNGQVMVNQTVVTKNGYFLMTNDLVIVNQTQEEKTTSSWQPYDLPLNFVYEDDHLMVINKPSGLLSHPNGFEKKFSVVNQLAYYWSTKPKNTTLIRNGLVHRLDQNTSGLMLVAKNNHSLSHLLGQFANRTITKKYYALIVGKLMAPHLRVNVPIGKSSSGQLKMVANGGKNQKIAISLIEEVEQFTNHSLVRCQLLTGRTHQIRVHLSYLKCPIVNDPLYGNYLADNYGQYLHAYYLKFIHPVSGQTIELTVPWDQVFEQQYQRLKHWN